MLTFFASPLGKWAIFGLMLIAAFGAGAIWGIDHEGEKLVKYVQKQAEEATRIGKVRTEVTERVVTRYLEKKAATELKTKEIEKETKDYADKNPSNMCIDATWLRLHDSAAANTSAKPPPVPSSLLRTTDAGHWYTYSGTGLDYGYGQLRPPSSLR